MLEKHIEAAVCRYAESKGFVQYKFSSPAHLGVPDRIFFGDLNCVFLIEFKRQGGKLTPAQEREAQRLKALAHRVYLVDDVEFGKEVIDSELALLARMLESRALFVRSMTEGETCH
jgi:hypothetical protein